MFRLGCLLLLIMTPVSLEAAVIINEIAWMGSSQSANDEWIELHNTGGSSVDVSGWTLSDGGNLEIALSGTIAPGAYALLERTDDSSAPGSAFLIYTGALNNAGATLGLRDSLGNLVDQVAGGTDWGNVGGDNVSKETAQYTPAGWITASPTPGAANRTLSSVNDKDDDEEIFSPTDEGESDDTKVPVTTATSKSAAAKSTEIKIEERNLKLTLIVPKIAYVEQPIELEVKASGLPRGWLESLHYYWNLGDLSTYTDKQIVHRYDYPGQYVVQLEADYAGKKAKLRHEITVLPVAFSLGTNAKGDIQVHNQAKYEIDVSGYKLGGIEAVEFPEGTILLPNSTITIPKSHLKTDTTFVQLSNQVGAVMATYDPNRSQTLALNEPSTNRVVTIANTSSVGREVSSAPAQDFRFPDEEIEATAPVPEMSLEAAESATSSLADGGVGKANAAAVVEAPVSWPEDKLPWLGLVAVLSVGLLAVYASKFKSLS